MARRAACKIGTVIPEQRAFVRRERVCKDFVKAAEPLPLLLLGQIMCYYCCYKARGISCAE